MLEDISTYLRGELSTVNFKITRITGGLSGSVLFKLTSENRNYVLRINRDQDSLREWQSHHDIQILTAQHEISPRVIDASLEKRFIISEFIDAMEFTQVLYQKDFKNHRLPQIARLLRSTHQLSIKSSRVSSHGYKNHDNQIQKLSESLTDLPSILRDAIERFAKLSPQKEIDRSSLIHQDLNPTNILFTEGRSYFIDWEDAAYGPWLYDLAILCNYFHLDKDSVNILMRSYLDREPSHDEESDLHFFRLYAYIEYAITFFIMSTDSLEKKLEAHSVDSLPSMENCFQRIMRDDFDLGNVSNRIDLGLAHLQGFYQIVDLV